MIWVNHNEPGYADLVAFISARIWGEARAMTDGMVAAVTRGNRIVAAVLFHNWNRASQVIEISGASESKSWLSRGVLRELFGYAFNELGCQAVLARVDKDNGNLADRMEAYGFRRYEIPRLRGRDKTEVMLVLADDEWCENGFHKEYTK